MKILVTGSTGMLGRAILTCLKQERHEILAPLRAQLDLTHSTETFNYINLQKPELIIHCAAQVGGIAANIEYPADFLLNNIRIDNNVLSSARGAQVQNFIYIASSCMYPKDYRQPLSESDLLQAPLEPTNEGYAIAKIAGSKSTIAIGRQDKLNWKVLIPSNLYGPWDSYDPLKSHLLASIVRKVSEAKVSGEKFIEVWGSGDARREFTFVGDVANFISVNLSTINNWPEFMNLGCGEDFTVNEFYLAAMKVAGLNLTLRHNLSKPEGMMRKLLDSNLARNHGWRPRTTLQEGLSAAFDDYLQRKSIDS